MKIGDRLPEFDGVEFFAERIERDVGRGAVDCSDKKSEICAIQSRGDVTGPLDGSVNSEPRFGTSPERPSM
jgi:hypothetical protein